MFPFSRRPTSDHRPVEDRRKDGRPQRHGGRRGRVRKIQRPEEDPAVVGDGGEEAAHPGTRSKTIRGKSFVVRPETERRKSGAGSDADAAATAERRSQPGTEVLGQHVSKVTMEMFQ